jgi:hypothetical protein
MERRIDSLEIMVAIAAVTITLAATGNLHHH